ncbi:class I SAM-dependent DNA methyltransferase [Halopiger goleimassiliensis]|uniref:class I SAM-dependent DNA methyltransferase n=1 Tax=Halopiger goleimassiliensis TaxID=1293048 RepID=UPI00067771B7|nr:class I SAM-dependent methyltransferase [Halopiger goleimassiliensis]
MTERIEGHRGERARLYDALLTAEREDVEFYVDLARRADGPVLEAACGTGRIYLELLAAGVDADGFDRSRDMLEILRESAAERGLEPSVWQADLTDVGADRRYALVTCPFNTVMHLGSIDEQLAALRSIYDALAPGGRFVFDVFVPSFEVICEEYGTWQTESVETDGESYEVRTHTQVLDELEGRILVETECYDADGSLVFASEDRLSLLPKRHLELLARCSPFDSWSATGDFSDEPLSADHSIQVWSLRRADDA